MFDNSYNELTAEEELENVLMSIAEAMRNGYVPCSCETLRRIADNPGYCELLNEIPELGSFYNDLWNTYCK